MRLYRDSEETTDVQWFFITGRQLLPFHTRFASTNWTNSDGPFTGPGEIPEAKRRYANGNLPFPVQLGPFRGTPDVFLNGARKGDPLYPLFPNVPVLPRENCCEEECK